MRKVIVFCMTAFLLVGCGLIENKKDKEVDTTHSKDLVDERGLIQQAMEEQREFLKPGFVKEASDWGHGFDFFFQSTSYNQGTEELIHSVTYIHRFTDAFLPLVAEKNVDNDRFAKTVDKFIDAQRLEEINGYYGYMEEDGEKHYQYIAEEDGVTYYFENETDESKGLDAELVSMMGNALKSEGDGACSHFYDRFQFDLEQLHFPYMKKDDVENVEVEIGDLGYWAFDNNNFIKIAYDLGDDTILRYNIYGEDLYSTNVRYIEIKKEETKGGVAVTTFETDLEYQRIYLWEADELYYIFEVDSYNDSITTEDIYALIDSSRDDTRVFTDPDVFKNPTKEPTNRPLEEEIIQRFLELADE